MGFTLSKNIFKKPPSDPLNSWVFRVQFFYNSYDNKISNGLINELGFSLSDKDSIDKTPVKIDLPSLETHIVTQKFFGTEKSFPVVRKHGGDTTLEFYVHSEQSENDFIIYNFMKDWSHAFENGTGLYLHKEFRTVFDNIKIMLYDRTNRMVYSYNLINCIPTKLDIPQLNYETDEVMKFTLTVHYDDWSVETYHNINQGDIKYLGETLEKSSGTHLTSE